MPLLSAETFPLLPPAPPAVTPGRAKPARTAVFAPAVSMPRFADANDVADQSYWTAYDHYMIEREARAMRRIYVWAMLAKAWAALRPWVRA
jgi:hypothetical protein